MAEAGGYIPNPSEEVIKFGDAYRTLAETMTGGAVAVTPKYEGTGNRIVGFKPWNSFRCVHKLAPKNEETGFIDCYVKDKADRWLTKEQLNALVEALPSKGSQLPAGWFVDRANKAGVMRYKIDRIDDIDQRLPTFADVQDILAEAIDALHIFRQWLIDGGEVALLYGLEAAIEHHLDAATLLARKGGMAELADNIEDLRPV